MSRKVFGVAISLLLLFATCEVIAQKKDMPTFPPAEDAIKNDVDHWGLPFSDQKRRFDKAFAAFEAKYRNAHPGAGPLNYALGVETALRKVFRNKWWFKGEMTDAVSLSACRNEVESFQLAVIPQLGKEMKNVKVDWTALNGPGEIPRQNMRIYRVAFVKTLRAQYPTKHTGYWPDPLMPLAPFSIKGLDLGLLWCDVKVPKDAKPGDYEGALTVSPDGEPPLRMTVRLHVWNFTLPDRVPFRMTVWPQNREPKDWKTEMPPEKFLEYCAMFLEHHIDPCTVGSLYVNLKDFSTLDKNIQFCLDRGLQYFRAQRFKTDDEMKAYYGHIKAKGWLDKCFLYGAQDEPTQEQFNELVIPDTTKMRNLCPGLRILLATEWHPNLDKGVDIFMT
ncbi:hypothetical protein FJY63_10875, partial [Candidatus Sumerlaeota bacterium]|nr:hypothetical protein [Candidatus Sumerlaeota bacterium]